MGYILEFRGEDEKNELIEKMHEAKEAVCEVMEMLEGADTMNERGEYRGGMYRRGGSYRRGMYREAYRDGNDLMGRGEPRYRDEMEMDYRRGRYSD